MEKTEKIRIFVNTNPAFSQDFIVGLTPQQGNSFFPVEESPVVSINRMNSGDILILYKNKVEQVFSGFSYIKHQFLIGVEDIIF